MVQTEKFCPFCGSQLSTAAQSCYQCGAPVADATPADNISPANEMMIDHPVADEAVLHQPEPNPAPSFIPPPVVQPFPTYKQTPPAVTKKNALPVWLIVVLALIGICLITVCLISIAGVAVFRTG